MKEYSKLLLALSMASKVIIKPKDAEAIKTVKNVSKENFNKLTIQHLLGKARLGVTPEILGQEDKIMFGVIDIDCPDISHEEKYKIALFPPFLVTIKEFSSKSKLSLSKPTNSLIRIPVPKNRVIIAVSRIFVFL